MTEGIYDGKAWIDLKRAVQGLQLLLDDPHPGLSTWVDAVNKRIRQIAEFGGWTA